MKYVLDKREQRVLNEQLYNQTNDILNLIFPSEISTIILNYTCKLIPCYKTHIKVYFDINGFAISMISKYTSYNKHKTNTCIKVILVV